MKIKITSSGMQIEGNSLWEILPSFFAPGHSDGLIPHVLLAEPWCIAIPSSAWSVQGVPWELQAAHQVYFIMGAETDGAAAKAGGAEHLVNVLI